MLKKLFAFAIMVLCCSCDCSETFSNSFESTRFSIDQSYHIIEIYGHLYIIYDGFNAGGIIHAEHCPCKNSKL